ncbi:hypothetical protein [Paenochrobactrum glaciei]|uniref:Uncharacterized protein n=1 Tax=Paenochrobactrum glaciei TaxID=486407 RepID=A0ABN1FVE7_9HYPH
MKVIGLILNRLLLLCALLFLLSGVAAVIIDAARSIGGSVVTFTSLSGVMLDFGFQNGLEESVHADGFAGGFVEYLFNLPAVAVLMALALLFYLLSYIFKKA